jgi:hypothetical protein
MAVVEDKLALIITQVGQLETTPEHEAIHRIITGQAIL